MMLTNNTSIFYHDILFYFLLYALIDLGLNGMQLFHFE